MSDRLAVSIIIPALNAEATIDDTLAALTAQASEDDFEVIVADNGSTDDTRAAVERWRDRLPLRVVDASARRGQAAAMNIAAAQARGDLLVFTDGDDVALPGWLDAWRTLDPSVTHASGPVVWFGYDDDPPELPVAAPSRLPVHMGFLAYALGTNFAVRRERLDRTTGFDEHVAPAQDVELSWRLQLDGDELVFVAEAVLAKRERRGLRDVMRQYYRYGLCDPILYRRYRASGVPRPRAGATLKSYVGLMARLVLFIEPEQRVRWACQVGRRAGRLVGSARERVFYP